MKIKSVRKIENTSKRYDIEVAAFHNYFASGILVHNCNLKVTYQNDKLWVSSHSFYRDEDDKEALFWRAVTANPWIETFCKANPGVFLFAEIFGWVQDLKYGTNPGELMVRTFDVDDGVSFWDADRFMDTFTAEQRVPVIYRGPYSTEAVLAHMNGQSTLAKHVREGIVIRPIKERFDYRLGRACLKAVSPEYLERSK